VPLHPHSPRRRWLVVGWVDILLHVISGVMMMIFYCSFRNKIYPGKRGTGGMSEDHDRCFSMLVPGAFLTGIFQHQCIPRINIDADVWGETSIMTGVY